ncbi:peroxidase 3-like protein [Tanacetum coccineum]
MKGFWSFGLIMVVGVLSILGSVKGDLQMGFYSSSCQSEKDLSKICEPTLSQMLHSLAATFIRMPFHDCFCLVLLNFTSSSGTNREGATPNRTVRGFGFIDAIKSLIESECPGVVSCADIIALAARDSIVLTPNPAYRIRNITILYRVRKQSLDLKDLVLLSGAHTIGISHCPSFSNRLYNFTGRGDRDPSLDSEYADNLRSRKCTTQNDNTTIVEMDPGSRNTFDLSYYSLLLKRRGLFESDSALTRNSNTLTLINQLLQGSLQNFFSEFALSMEKMNQIGVKTGTTGEIRRNCAVVNS